MTPENFCYWLQGYLEIATAGDVEDDLTPEQVQCIKDHLALVFQKVTPSRDGKKKKKAKKISDLQVLAEDSEVIAVVPAINRDQIRINIEEAFKKLQKKDEESLIVTCDATPTPTTEELMDKVKKTVERSRDKHPHYPSPTRWIGGGIGQKYC